MRFDEKLRPDQRAALLALGFGTSEPDRQTGQKLADAAVQLEKSATPRWIFRRFVLQSDCRLQGTNLSFQGRSIRRHLAGCHACLLLALTLGDGVERVIRAAEAADMAGAVLLDTLATTLVEQYADAAQQLLHQRALRPGEFMTARFSPGYGDLPLQHQREVLHLLDAQRAIGLSVSQSGIMLPRKSVTAVLGVADQPVSGHLAGCDECALRDKCGRTRPCAKGRKVSNKE